MISRAWLACLIFSLSAGLGHQALALTQDDAENALAKANNDYFNSLVAGQARTPDQLEKLKADTVIQAQQNLDQVVEGKWHQAMNQQSSESDSANPDDSEWPQIRALLSGRGGGRSAPAYSRGRPAVIDPSRAQVDGNRKPASLGSPATASGQDRPAVALDGKAIPKYLEFPGRAQSP